MLTPRGRLKLWGLAVLMLLAALMEAVGIASWIPFVAFGTDPGVVEKNAWLHRLYELGGFSQYSTFLAFLGGMVLFLFLLGNACQAASLWCCYRFTWHENHRISQALLRRYLGRPYVWFLDKNTADLTKNVIEEVYNLVDNVILKLCRILGRGFLALIICAGLLIIDPLVAVTTAVLLSIVYAVFYRGFRRRLARIGRDRLESNTLRYKTALEALSAAKEARIPVRRGHFVAAYRRHSFRMNEVMISNKLIGDLPQYLTEGLAVGGMLAVMVYFMVTQGGSSTALPLIALYIVATIRLAPALQNLYHDVVRIRFFLPSLERVSEDLKDDPAGSPPLEDEDRLALEHALRLEDVDFTYPGAAAPAVRRVSLEIRPRTTTALVGKTGAGKTTLADVVAGLLVPQRGTMTVDGVPLTPERTARWQANMGYVPQEIYLLDDTVRRNIAFGIPDDRIDDVALVRAARTADIHDLVVRSLANGYDTVLGERGITLSGGQRQRIGIARALYHDPDVLLLDEATNSLDRLTERGVMEAVKRLAHRKTILVIAHRLSTVRACETVCFLEGGELRAQGKYRDLTAACPAFRELVREDLSGASEDGSPEGAGEEGAAAGTRSLDAPG